MMTMYNKSDANNIVVCEYHCKVQMVLNWLCILSTVLSFCANTIIGTFGLAELQASTGPQWLWHKPMTSQRIMRQVLLQRNNELV